MATNAKMVELARDLKAIEEYRKSPENSKLRRRDLIRITRRCRLCGRPRAVYRKFGICRICFRNLASDGLIPGVRKASW